MQQRTEQQRNSRQDQPGRYRSREASSGQYEYGPMDRQDVNEYRDFDRGAMDDRNSSGGNYGGRREFSDAQSPYRSNQDDRGQYGNDFQNPDRFSNRDYGNREFGRDQFGRPDYFQNYGQSRAGQFNEYGGSVSNWGGGDFSTGRDQFARGEWTENRGQPGRDDVRQSRGERGQFAGSGPKNYRRSDERIQEDLCEQLTRHPDIDATDIDCKVKDGEVVLSGTVGDRHCKRMAEDLAENISGVKDVRNEIRVKREGANGDEHIHNGQSQRSNGKTQATRM